MVPEYGEQAMLSCAAWGKTWLPVWAHYIGPGVENLRGAENDRDHHGRDITLSKPNLGECCSSCFPGHLVIRIHTETEVDADDVREVKSLVKMEAEHIAKDPGLGAGDSGVAARGVVGGASVRSVVVDQPRGHEHPQEGALSGLTATEVSMVVKQALDVNLGRK